MAACSRVLRPLAEADANWTRLFMERFPRLVTILGSAQPQWWVGATWRHRYAALCSGAPFHAQVYNREQGEFNFSHPLVRERMPTGC